MLAINFGEAPYQQACNVVEKLANEISCIVPDYRGMKTGPNKTVPIEIYLSGNMIKPEVDTIVGDPKFVVQFASVQYVNDPEPVLPNVTDEDVKSTVLGAHTAVGLVIVNPVAANSSAPISGLAASRVSPSISVVTDDIGVPALSRHQLSPAALVR